MDRVSYKNIKGKVESFNDCILSFKCCFIINFFVPVTP